MFEAPLPAGLAAAAFTPRIVPRHPLARLPAEVPLVAWPR